MTVSILPNGGWKEGVRGLFPARIKTFFLPPEDVEGLGYQEFLYQDCNVKLTAHKYKVQCSSHYQK